MMRLLPRFAVPLVLISVLAANAMADPGINLSWNDCGSFGVADKAFGCASNAGTNVMYCSFIPPAGIDSMVAVLCVLDLTSSSGLIPPWWELGTGGCRVGKISMNQNFTAGPFNCGGSSCCVDFWQGNATGGLFYMAPFDSVNFTTTATALNVNHARIKGGGAVPHDFNGPVDSSTQYYALSFSVSNALSSGIGSCTGCSIPVCIVLNTVAISEPAPIPDFILTGPPTGGRNQITWQGGAGANCASVPVKNKTWGQIKSLYR
jgi:hypothetical protein